MSNTSKKQGPYTVTDTLEQIAWRETVLDGDDLLYHADLVPGGRGNVSRFTILEVMTGSGGRVVESAFTDQDANFWLTGRGLDIREHPEWTVQQAIDYIQANAIKDNDF